MPELNGPAYFKSKLEEREFVSNLARMEWLFTVFYMYLAYTFNQAYLDLSISTADSSVGKDKIAIGVQ